MERSTTPLTDPENGAQGGARKCVIKKFVAPKLRTDELGQVLIEGILWTTLFMIFAIAFLKVSNTQYRAYRGEIRSHDSRAGRGSFP